MKITKQQLKQLIEEELASALGEEDNRAKEGFDYLRGMFRSGAAASQPRQALQIALEVAASVLGVELPGTDSPGEEVETSPAIDDDRWASIERGVAPE